ncbi:MAG: hypothetical protein ACI4JW_07415 [Oscillospiraceae bacterium]
MNTKTWFHPFSCVIRTSLKADNGGSAGADWAHSENGTHLNGRSAFLSAHENALCNSPTS